MTERAAVDLERMLPIAEEENAEPLASTEDPSPVVLDIPDRVEADQRIIDEPVASGSPPSSDEQVEQDVPRSERPMNELAVIAFVGGWGGLLLGIFFGTGLWILAIAGFVLGIIALIQILHRKERGLGFAIAAILGIAGMLALVYLAMYNDP